MAGFNILDSILPIGGDLINSVVNSIGARRRQKREFAQQVNLLDRQNAFTEKMWNLQNEYNDPSAQMDRLTAAGINPIDAAAGVSGSPGNAASVTSSGAPSVPQISGSPVMTANLGDSVQRGMMFRHQLEAQELANKNMKEENYRKWAENQYIGIEKYLNMQTVTANLKNLAAQYNLTSEQARQITFDVDKLMPEKKRLTRAEADNLEATAKLTLGQVDKNNQEIENLKKQREEINARITNINQSTDLLSAETASAEQDVHLKKDQHEMNQIDKRIKELDEDNAKLVNQYKHDLSNSGHDPNAQFSYSSAVGISYAEGVRYSINSDRSYQEKVKRVEKWNKQYPSQKMRITPTGDVVFVNQHKNTPIKSKPKSVVDALDKQMPKMR